MPHLGKTLIGVLEWVNLTKWRAKVRENEDSRREWILPILTTQGTLRGYRVEMDRLSYRIFEYRDIGHFSHIGISYRMRANSRYFLRYFFYISGNIFLHNHIIKALNCIKYITLKRIVMPEQRFWNLIQYFEQEINYQPASLVTRVVFHFI